MVRIRGDLDESLSRFFHNSIQGPLDEFCSHYACAGIKDNELAAHKAYGNHYGTYFIDDKGRTVPIPRRQFIWGAIKDIEEGNVGFTASEIRDILVKAINTDPRIRKKQMVASEMVAPNVFKDKFKVTQRDKPVLKGGDFDGVFKKLATKMAERLSETLETVNIVGSYQSRAGGTTKIPRPDDKHGMVWGDIRHNAPSTIAHKGFDKPLEETGQMIDEIQGWTDGED